MSSSIMTVLKLGLLIFLCLVLIATTEIFARQFIVASEDRANQKYLLQVLPEGLHGDTIEFTPLPVDPRYWQILGLSDGGDVHIAHQHQLPIGVVIPTVTAAGYGGNIHLLVGIDLAGKITGVRVTEHRETMGLGDAIDITQSLWVESFIGRSLTDPKPSRWALKLDGGIYDHFTGATITPRAVVNQVLATLEYFTEQHKETLERSHRDHSEGTVL